MAAVRRWVGRHIVLGFALLVKGPASMRLAGSTATGWPRGPRRCRSIRARDAFRDDD